MRTAFRTFTTTAVALSLVGALSACSTGSDANSSGEAGGIVYWYSGNSPERNDAVVAGFNEVYPDIEVEVLRGVTGDLTVRYAQESESNAPTADVISQTDPLFVEEGFDKDWWDTGVEPADGWPEEYNNNGDALTSYHVLELGINADAVPSSEVPTSWEQLLEPTYSGRLLLLDPRSDPGYLALLQFWSEEYGDEFLTGLASQDPRFVASNVPGSEALASGSADIMAPIGRTGAQPQIDAGAPLEVHTIEPTLGIEFHTTVSSNSPNPEAAALFFEYLTSVDGQQGFNGALTVSVRDDVEGALPRPEGMRPLMDYLPAANERKDELLGLIGVQ